MLLAGGLATAIALVLLEQLFKPLLSRQTDKASSGFDSTHLPGAPQKRKIGAWKKIKLSPPGHSKMSTGLVCGGIL
jgi:hypothetical protein